MIQLTMTIKESGPETCSIQYKVDNMGDSRGENTVALSALALLQVFFNEPGKDDFLTEAQGEKVSKQIELIVEEITEQNQGLSNENPHILQ